MLQDMYKENTVEAIRNLAHVLDVALQEELGDDRSSQIHHEVHVKHAMSKVLEVYTEWSVLRCHNVQE